MLAVLVLGSEMPSWFSRTICRTLNTDVLLKGGSIELASSSARF